MVSAGLDTVPGNLIMAIGYLSSPHGQEIQEHAYAEIQKVYPNGDAWEKCLIEEHVPYITAFVKEVLRFWTVIPICLPRTSIKEIKWQDAIIPAGTTFYMVIFAIIFPPQSPILPTTLSVPLRSSYPSLRTDRPSHRTPMPPTTTPHTSLPHSSSAPSATSTPPMVPAPRTTATAPARACAPARTSQIASCTQLSSVSSRRCGFSRPKMEAPSPCWTLWTVMPSKRA